MASFLLLWMVMALVACPFPVVDELPNQPFMVDEAAIDPALGLVRDIDCALPTNVTRFDISRALEDPDGDELSVFWFIDYTEEVPTLPVAEGTIYRAPCLSLRDPPDVSVIEAVVMDREPVDPDDAAGTREPQKPGFIEFLVWVVRK